MPEIPNKKVLRGLRILSINQVAKELLYRVFVDTETPDGTDSYRLD